MIGRHSAIPMYRQIADYIKNKIVLGVYAEGTKIPTEVELMEQFKVSRTTVRLAMKNMLELGLIEKHPGKGTFVRKERIYHPLKGFKSLYDTLLEANIVPETEILSFSQVKPSTHICKSLKISAEQSILKIERLYHQEGKPIAFAQIIVHPRLSDCISVAEAKKHPVYQILEKKGGFKIQQAHLEIFALNASNIIADALAIKKNDSVLGTERVLYTENIEPVEHTLIFFRSDSYRFTLSLQGDTTLQISDMNHSKSEI